MLFGMNTKLKPLLVAKKYAKIWLETGVYNKGKGNNALMMQKAKNNWL